MKNNGFLLENPISQLMAEYANYDCLNMHFILITWLTAYFNSQKILPFKTAADPASSTGIKGQACCPKLQEES